MSMLDSFFNKGFKGAKCKTLLKLTIPRIKLLRNRKEIQLKQMRRDIAKLLENGQEATARIRVEHIIREENMMAAQEIMELFCELIAVRLPIIETQRECPLDLKEAISSICFAAPRCSDLPELQQVQMLFAVKYGKEFVLAATELLPDCGVNRQIIELLSVRAPSVEAKLKLLKEIADEHELDWDPADSETEFLKPHEDLLNGPSNFISGSTLPLPKEKHEDPISSEPVKESEDEEEFDTDAGFDVLDLPEVPRATVRASSDIPSAPEVIPQQPTSPSHHFENSEATNAPHFPSKGHELAFPYTAPNASVATGENRQFIPFVSSPSLPSVVSPSKQSEPAPTLPQSRNEDNMDPPSPPSAVSPLKRIEQTPSLSRTKSEASVDLQDVLAAAHAAAETAERAAAAARAVASLAQVRITALGTKKSIRAASDSSDDFEPSDQFGVAVGPMFDQQRSFDVTRYDPQWSSSSPTLSSEHQHDLNPIRSASLEDDSIFSYPNLFASQNSNLKSADHSVAEDSPSHHGF